MRLLVNVDVCVESGQCVLTDPELFDQDEYDGTVVLLATEVPAEAEDRVRAAVDLCPSQALSLTED